jgi:hypothetical protein
LSPEENKLKVFQGAFATRGGWILAETGTPNGDILIGGSAIEVLEADICVPTV